jgi:hypothetical protein
MLYRRTVQANIGRRFWCRRVRIVFIDYAAHATSTGRQPSRVRAQFVDDGGAYWEPAKREDPSQRWAVIQATRRNSALWQLGDAGPRGLRLT